MSQSINKPNESQEQRILNVLVSANGQWVSGQYFLRDMMLSQYHARIFGLQKKGHAVEASNFTDSFGFKSYRLISDCLNCGRLESQCICHEDEGDILPKPEYETET